MLNIPELGTRVIDKQQGHKGVIVKVVLPENGEGSDEDHGTIYVWQEDKFNYGGDNCEHYCLNNWTDFLRIM